MAGAGLLTPLESDDAILSGGDWTIGLPLANLQDMQPTNTARSTDATNVSTVIVIDAGTARAWDCLYLGRTNLSASATIRIRAATSEANLTAAPGFDSGAISAWPVTGRPTDRGLVWFDVFKQISPGGSFRWWQIDIDDDTNADDYVEIGRLVFGPLWQPTYQHAPGVNRTFDPSDVRIKTPYGHTLTDRRLRPRVWSVPFPVMTRADAEDMAEEIMRLIGTAGDLVVCLEPEATTRLHRQTMLATFSGASGIERIAPDIYRITFTFEQLL